MARRGFSTAAGPLRVNERGRRSGTRQLSRDTSSLARSPWVSVSGLIPTKGPGRGRNKSKKRRACSRRGTAARRYRSRSKERPPASAATASAHRRLRNLRSLLGPRGGGTRGKPQDLAASRAAGVFAAISPRLAPLKDLRDHPPPKERRFNDYRPVALTPVIPKRFKKPVRTHVVSCLSLRFDVRLRVRGGRRNHDSPPRFERQGSYPTPPARFLMTPARREDETVYRDEAKRSSSG